MSTAPSSRLRAARFARGWSQLDLARHLGITAGAVNFWEHGKTPRPAMRAKISQLLGADPWADDTSTGAA